MTQMTSAFASTNEFLLRSLRAWETSAERRRSWPDVRSPKKKQAVVPSVDMTAALGELVDTTMISVEGKPEVRLQFAASALGGVLVILRKDDVGLMATMRVQSAAQQREMLPHADALLAHLRARGLHVHDVRVEVS
jgi:hypothetical protein